MAMIKCEMCGSTDIIKQDGVFVCQSCGIKYSPEEAKKMMVEVAGTVAVKGSVKVENAVSAESLLKRAFMTLEEAIDDEDAFGKANELFDRVLDINPECAEAYLGKLLLEYGFSRERNLARLEEPFDSSKNYQKIMKFGSPELCARIKKINDGVIEAISRRNAEFKKTIMPYAVKAARKPIACEKGGGHIVALRCDGTVVATGDNAKGQCNVSDWRDIIAVAAGYNHTVGLKSDGTVVAVGDNGDGQCNVSGWNDIVALAAGRAITVGLKSNGRLVIANDNFKFNSWEKALKWEDIVAITVYYARDVIVGLKSDGTVVATNNSMNCAISLHWGDEKIVAISGGMGLRVDGTVVKHDSFVRGGIMFTAPDVIERELAYVDKWENIVAISSNYSESVGLKDDGTVVAKSANQYGKGEVTKWKNIVAIEVDDCGDIAGLRSDGTVLTTSKNYREEVSHWKDIMPVSTAKTFEEDRQQKIEIIRANHSKIVARQEEERLAEEKRKEEERKEIEKSIRRSQGVCQYCGGAFKGLFSKKCSVCGRPKDY